MTAGAGRRVARVAGHAALVALVWLGVVLGVPAGRVHADAAGPSDYRSEVVSVTPATDAVDVRIEGGDSFVLLAVEPGTDVTVLGYQGEPYLWVAPDGTVSENVRSPATYLNDERYGTTVPDVAAAGAEPEWRRVADGGRYAWHDHRAHRMERFPPVNVERGEQVLDGVVPLVVDGRPVEVHVVSTWMPAPSPVPGLLGTALGLLLGGLAIGARRNPRTVASIVAALAAGATVIGVWQFVSLPAETGPRTTWWLLPVAALVFSAGAALAGRGSTAWAATTIAAVQLLIWAIDRRDVLRRAVLPTDAPAWLDRFVTAATTTGAALAGAVAFVALLRPLVPRRRPAPV